MLHTDITIISNHTISAAAVPDQDASKNSSKKQTQITLDINEAHARLGHINEQQIRLTYKDTNIHFTETMKPCTACLCSKAKRDSISKETVQKTDIQSERMYVDTAGPFTVAIDGHKYWVQTVDYATHMGFCFFLKAKNKIADGLQKNPVV